MIESLDLAELWHDPLVDVGVGLVLNKTTLSSRASTSPLAVTPRVTSLFPPLARCAINHTYAGSDVN